MKAAFAGGFLRFSENMQLAESSRQKLETFFREFTEDERFELPPINFHVGKLTYFFTRVIRVNGITFGRRIFIFPAFLSLNKSRHFRLPEELVAHEIVHVLQYQREGFIKFLYKYLRDYWRNLRRLQKWDLAARQQAYLEIPFEIEARAAAREFLQWFEKQQ